MKLIIPGLVLVALLGQSGTALAECKLKSSNAIFCTAPKRAAHLFQLYGFDVKKTDLSHNRQFLLEAGCSRPYGASYTTAKLRLVSQGKVATPDGWVSVSSLIINDKDIGYVASEYLSGTCERHVAPSHSVSTLPAG